MKTTNVLSPAALLLLLGVTAAAPSLAATFTVSNTDDDGEGSLRAAIVAANGATGADVIDFSVTGTITLLSALPIVVESLDIIGPGAGMLVIDGNQDQRHFRFAGPVGSSYRIQGLTLRNGFSSDAGGSVLVSGNAALEVDGCIIEDSVATAEGGGIAAFGPVQISNTTLRGNRGTFGGGLYAIGADHTVKRSAVLLNTAEQGGGVYAGAGVELELENVTIAGNMAQDGFEGGFGGGISIAAGTTAISHVTLADNIADQGGGIALVGGLLSTFANNVLNRNSLWNEQPSNCLGNLPDDFANLSSDGTCQMFGESDLENTDPLLAGLALNGGTTPSLLPLPGSPAIDSAATGFCAARDQRDLLRPEGPDGLCDRGALEVYPEIDHQFEIFFDGFE